MQIEFVDDKMIYKCESLEDNLRIDDTESVIFSVQKEDGDIIDIEIKIIWEEYYEE